MSTVEEKTQPLPAEFTAGKFVFRLNLNYRLARDLRQLHRVDLINFHSGAAIKVFSENRDKIFDTIYFLAKDQVIENGLDEPKFAELFDDAVFEAAFNALEEAIVNFTEPAKRPVILQILKRTREIESKQSEMVVEKIGSEKATEAINRAMNKEAEKIDQHLDQLTSTKEG